MAGRHEFPELQGPPARACGGNSRTYDRTALMAMFESFDGMECFLEDHPLAEKVLKLATLSDVDALILSDMPGGDPWSGPDHQVDPSPALHHATAAWTTGPDWTEAMGVRDHGRFGFH